MKLTDKQKLGKLKYKIRQQNKYIKELIAYAKSLTSEIITYRGTVYYISGGVIHESHPADGC